MNSYKVLHCCYTGSDLEVRSSQVKVSCARAVRGDGRMGNLLMEIVEVIVVY